VEITFGQESPNELGTLFGVRVLILPKEVSHEQQTLLQELEVRPFHAVELLLEMSLVDSAETSVDKTEIVDPYMV